MLNSEISRNKSIRVWKTTVKLVESLDVYFWIIVVVLLTAEFAIVGTYFTDRTASA
jgi:hypothetical protein